MFCFCCENICSCFKNLILFYVLINLIGLKQSFLFNDFFLRFINLCSIHSKKILIFIAALLLDIIVLLNLFVAFQSKICNKKTKFSADYGSIRSPICFQFANQDQKEKNMYSETWTIISMGGVTICYISLIYLLRQNQTNLLSMLFFRKKIVIEIEFFLYSMVLPLKGKNQ